MIKMETYFRINETPRAGNEDLKYPQLTLHFPAYNVQGEQPLYEYKDQIGTLKWQQATLDVSELRVARPTDYDYSERDKNPNTDAKPKEIVDKEHIVISPGINEVKRYASITMDNDTAHRLAINILEELEK